MSIQLKGNTDSSFSNDINISDKISLNTDGTASFAGAGLFGSSSASTTQSGTYIDATGGVIVNIVTDTDSNRLWIGKNKNVIKSQIFANGAATFADTVTAGNSTTGCEWFSNGSGKGSFNGNQVWYFNNNGNATFAGTVTSSNVTAFKTALTSAVTASTDHASLKAAILSALASL